MPAGKGQVIVDVLEDGTVRAETGDMSGVSHKAADDFMALLAQLMGGQVTDQKAKQSHHHHHDHAHDHAHDHERQGQ
jgi:hypothetical protein